MLSNPLRGTCIAPIGRILVLWASLVAAFALGCERNQTLEQSKQAIGANVEASSETISSESKKPFSEILNETKIERHKVLLKIDVSGFNQSDGMCRIAVYLGPKHFNAPEFAIAKESIELHDSMASVAISVEIPLSTDQLDAESNRLAVSAYHDQNGNEQLDKNSFGIPTEQYGFSKNPKRGFGPPKFNEVAIELKAALVLGEPLEVPITVK